MIHKEKYCRKIQTTKNKEEIQKPSRQGGENAVLQKNNNHIGRSLLMHNIGCKKKI